jgi:hypothetical protein
VLFKPVQHRLHTTGCQGNTGVGGTIVQADGIAIGGNGVTAGKDDVINVAMLLVRFLWAKHPFVAAFDTVLRCMQVKQGHTQPVNATCGRLLHTVIEHQPALRRFNRWRRETDFVCIPPAGCGETPYFKLLSQLFGERATIANPTDCSSIYGGNLPTTPWAKNKDGRGPAWSNSLFEDNAEFGLGFRLTLDKQTEYARELLLQLKDTLGAEFVTQILDADQTNETGIYEQRRRIETLKATLETLNGKDSVSNLRPA